MRRSPVVTDEHADGNGSLAILLSTRLVRARRVRRERSYRLQPQPLEEIYDWVALYERFWTNKLSALGEHLRKRS